MGQIHTLQTALTSGVLSPGLAARTDIQHYYQGMRRGINVICVKEGGARGRWGRQYIDDVAGNGRLIEFSFNTEQNYVLVFSALKLEIWQDDTKVTNINGGGLDYLVTPWSDVQALEFDYTQSADTLVIMHEDVQTQTLVRTSAHTGWTLGAWTTANLPKFDFNDSDSPATVDHEVDLTFNSFSDGDRYKLELENFETPEIVYSSTDTAANARRIKEELLLLPPTGFADTSIAVVFSAGTTYQITFTGESADDYEDMTGRNTDNTSASITLATTQAGSPRREEVISATRGYPKHPTFFESRLLAFGLKSLPQSMIGTVIGGFNPFDFKLGTGLDDQGIFVTLNTNEVNSFRAAYPGRHLQTFTSGGEFYFPDRPLTPAPSIPRQSRFGCAEGIRPVEIDGATIYVTRDRKTIREYLFLWAEEAYNATSLTVLASHLFNNIQDLDALTSTTDDEDSYLAVINGDGTGAILNTLRAQDIAAWTQDIDRTGDNLKQATVVGDDIYYLVERQRDGATVYTLEKASYDTRMDSSKKVTTGLGLTTAGFSHLAGEVVQVLVDGAPVDDVTVSAAGEITLAEAPTVSLEAGYFNAPIIETMPLVVDIGFGPLLGVDKRIENIRVHVKDTLGLLINGVQVGDSKTGVTRFGTLDAPFTGILEGGELGYTEDDATITLTQEQPLPFHVLAIAGRLDIGDD